MVRLARPRWGPVSGWRIAVPVMAACAGALFVTSAVNAAGTDLRPATTDLSTLVSGQADSVASLRDEARALRRDVAALSASIDDEAVQSAREQLDQIRPGAGMTEVRGRGMVVILDDAPSDVDVPPGENPNILVVHQQDIQAFVNALWAGGATAISLQGQRLVSTTGIKCVGNTVVLEGVPYSPPYRIEAVGNVPALQAALDGSAAVLAYQSDVIKHDLGLDVSVEEDLTIPAYDGTTARDLEYATVLD